MGHTIYSSVSIFSSFLFFLVILSRLSYVVDRLRACYPLACFSAPQYVFFIIAYLINARHAGSFGLFGDGQLLNFTY